MNLRTKLIALSLAIELLWLLIPPIPVSARNETWYTISLDGNVESDEFETIGNSAGTRFKTKYVQYGEYILVELNLDGTVFKNWCTRTSLGANPGDPHQLDGVEWIFHHIHMYSDSMHCVFVLRYETSEGYDHYTLRLILHVSGKGAGTYTDANADVEIEQGAQLYNPQQKGPKKTMFHIKDQFQASITIHIS